MPARCLETPLRQHRAGGEREQLALARGNRRADQSDDEREMRGERRRAGNAGVEEAPQHDLGQRQDHDAERGERGDEILRLARPAPVA